MKLFITHSITHLTLGEDVTMQFRKVDARLVALDLINLPHENRELVASIGNQDIANAAVKSIIAVAPVFSGLNLFAREAVELKNEDKVYVCKKLQDGSVEWRALLLAPQTELSEKPAKARAAKRQVASEKADIKAKTEDAIPVVAAEAKTVTNHPIWKSFIKYSAFCLIALYVLHFVGVNPASAGFGIVAFLIMGVRRLKRSLKHSTSKI